MICLTVLRATALEASLLTAPASSPEAPSWGLVNGDRNFWRNTPSPLPELHFVGNKIALIVSNGIKKGLQIYKYINELILFGKKILWVGLRKEEWTAGT